MYCLLQMMRDMEDYKEYQGILRVHLSQEDKETLSHYTCLQEPVWSCVQVKNQKLKGQGKSNPWLFVL